MADFLEQLSQRPLFKKILENSSWQIGDRAIRLGLNFFITAWIARYLGPESYGKLSYVVAFVSIFQVFSSLGIEWILVREFAAAPESCVDKVASIIKLRVLTGFAGQLILVGIIWFTGTDNDIHMMALSQSFLLLIQAFDTVDFWFQSRMEVRRVVIIRSFGFFIASGLRLFLLLGKFSLVSFIFPFLIEAVVANALLMRAYFQNEKGISGFWTKFDGPWLRQFLKGVPVLFFTAILLQMYLRIDQVLLEWLSGPRAVGIFSVPVRLSEVFYMVGSAVISASAPALFGVHQSDPGVLRIRLRKLFRSMNALSFGVCLAVVLVADPLIPWIFGEEYRSSVSVLRIYIWCLPAVLQGGIRNIWLMAEGRTGFALFAAALGTGISVVLNILLIPSLGVEGAAMAAVCAMWVSGIFSSFFSRSLRQIAEIQLESFSFWRKSF